MKIIKYRSILLGLVFFANVASGQFPLFENNDKVCFIGNSITMNGRFHNYIQLYYATRFPDKEIKFFNCGISGDVTGGVLRRMQADILVHQPTWSVLMIGMNDVRRSLYAKERENEAGIKQKQQDALTRYFTNVDSIVRILLQAKSKVILQTPSIYDQTADLNTPNMFGVNDALKKCAEFLEGLAVKYNLPIVDYWTIMSSVNSKIQKQDTKATIVGGDRVHPGVEGHFLMTYEFLKTQQVPGYVSLMSIDRKRQEVRKALQCTISDIEYYNSYISFLTYETSLPYPRLSKIFNPDSLASFTKDLNKEILQIKSLKKGNYQITIDSIIIGRYTKKNLKNGINLSNNNLTPQYRQSEKVLKLLNDYWDVVRKIRQVKYVEYQLLGGEMLQLQGNNEDNKMIIEKRLERFKDQPKEYLDFYRENFNEYLINKPMERELQVKADEMFTEIYRANKPAKHYYQVEKID